MDKDERLPAPNNVSPFERIRRTNAGGAEYWPSREFAQVLGYTDYRNFEQVIEKAKTACCNSGHRIEDHFVDISKMIPLQQATRTEESECKCVSVTPAFLEV
jgi:DNA-damage-inducible protein D